MLSRFFIDRPIFAWVIALFILVMGGVAIKQLPIAQYPSVAPPSIVVTAVYPGASAQTLEDSVISVIEQEMNGSPGLIYLESTSQANGVGQITLTFESGTSVDFATATPWRCTTSGSRGVASCSLFWTWISAVFGSVPGSNVSSICAWPVESLFDSM